MNYYLVSIDKIIDINRGNINFLEEMYPEIYKLYANREAFFLYDFYDNHKAKRKINVLSTKIELLLQENNLPEYLVFEGTDSTYKVKELFTKEEIYLTTQTLKNTIITKFNKGMFSSYLNKYTPEEIINISKVFKEFSQEKRKSKIITFPKDVRQL